MQDSTPPTSPAAPPPADGQAPEAPQSWFDRHGWKLMLVIIGLIALSALSCCGGVGYLVWQLFRSKAVYEMSVEPAVNDPRVIEALGAPIDAQWFMQGVINIENESGEAALRIPMKGSQRGGEVLSQLVRRDGQWRLRYLAVEVAGREGRIVIEDHRDEPLEGKPPPPIPPRRETEPNNGDEQ